MCEDMIDKSKIPKDPDTRSLTTQTLRIGTYNCVFEIWSWDGISGTSFIFDLNEAAESSDTELTDLVVDSLGRNAEGIQITNSRTSTHAFVNVFFPDEVGDIDDPVELTEEDLLKMREKRDQWVREHNASQRNRT